MVRPRSHLPSSAAPAPALDNDDILSEILRRLPPLPSSLPRASLVCKRWHRLVSDPHFLRHFREHHRKPPLLGFFSQDKDYNIEFTSTLNPPDNIPASRFFLRVENATDCNILDCRHGRVLVLNRELLYLLMWDPVTGDQQRMALPLLAFRYNNMMFVRGGAIVCAAGEEGHVHGACHSSPCQVVLLGHNGKGVFTCVYSSETGKWGSTITLLCPHLRVAPHFHSTLVGSSIYWLLAGNTFAILEFDLCRQSLACTELPPNAADLYTLVLEKSQFLIAPANGGGLIFFNLSGFSAKVWNFKVNCDGVSQWVLGNDVDIRTLLSLGPGMDDKFPEILGLVGDDNTMLLQTDAAGLFVVHLESMKVKKFSNAMSLSYDTHHPFTSFFSAGRIAEGAHCLRALSPTGSNTHTHTHTHTHAKRIICSLIRSERAASVMGRNAKNVGLQTQDINHSQSWDADDEY